LAQASNTMVYGSMTAFTGAMVAFSISLAKGRRLETIETSAQRTSASHQVRMGSTATLDKPSVSTSLSDDGDLGEGRRAGNIGMSLTWLGTLLLGMAILFRGLSAGRVPMGNMYEFSLAAGFAVSLTYCLMSISRDLRWLGVFITVPVLLDLGLALTVLYAESSQLVPALNSYWLAIHVSAAVVCFGAFTIGAALSGLYLVAQSAEDRVAAGKEPGRSAAIAQRIPSADRLDLMSYRIHAFMFPYLDLRSYRWRNLGGSCLGSLLGLGSKRDLGFHHLGYLRGLLARSSNCRLAWQKSRVCGNCGIRHDFVQLLCCEHLGTRPAFILRPLKVN